MTSIAMISSVFKNFDSNNPIGKIVASRAETT